MELSLAVPGKPVDMIAYNMTGVAKGLDESMDFWNLMTYDGMNRRDTITAHHAGGSVIAQNLAIYGGKLGLKPEKLNIGFPMYAKWFKLKKECKADPPIGCDTGTKYENEDGSDAKNSAALVFNKDIRDSDTMDGLWDTVNDDKHRDKDALASAAVVNNVFWTWLSPADIKESCEKYLPKAGGVMMWSINQDEKGADGGPHVDALAACVGA